MFYRYRMFWFILKKKTKTKNQNCDVGRFLFQIVLFLS